MSQAQETDISDNHSNKTVPIEIKAAVYKALAKFPELRETSIEFIYKENIRHAVMQAQPKIGSLIRHRSKRKYKINVSRYLHLGDSSMAIESLPQNILIGWFAHELGHIIDYKDRSSAAMIGFGVNYLTSRTFLTKAERMADTYAIGHGFANHIVQTKNYILHKSDLSEEYKNRIDDLYISPEEVREIEESLGALKDD